jgi:hypothetical protein
MQVTSHCPACYGRARFDSASAPAEIACPRCGARRAVELTPSVRERNVVDRCVLCGCGHLYLEKDFNGALGCAILLAAVVGSAVFWSRNVLVAVGILAAAAAADLLFWVFSRERTVCYKCVAVYAGAAANPAHGRYELGTAGRFAEDFDEQRKLHQGEGP